MTRPTRAAKSRRSFLKTVAMGSAAALAATLPIAAAAAPPRRRPRPAPAPPPAPAASPTLDAEIAKQKKSTADLLKTIRDYELLPGSEQAFVFAAAKPAAKRRGDAGGAVR